MVVRCVDPRGFWHIFHHRVCFFIANNITAALFAAGTLSFLLTVFVLCVSDLPCAVACSRLRCLCHIGVAERAAEVAGGLRRALRQRAHCPHFPRRQCRGSFY